MSTTTFSADSAKPEPGSKKNQGIMRSLRAALFGAKVKAKKTKTPLPSPGDTISTIVGSVRPLHVADIGSSPDRAWMASPTAPRSGMSSSYSSAQSLVDLDVVDEGPKDDDVEKFYDGVQGDELIDAKAEEFIARFYHQVRMEIED